MLAKFLQNPRRYIADIKRKKKEEIEYVFERFREERLRNKGEIFFSGGCDGLCQTSRIQFNTFIKLLLIAITRL